MKKIQKQHMYSKKKKLYKRQYFLLFIIILFSISFIYTLGRYATDTSNNFFTRTKEFYFNSDKLTEDNASFHIENWSGVDDYVITINMNSYNNNLQAATYDIGYDITYTCSNNIICQLSKTSGNILASTNTDFFNLIITPNANFDTGDRAYVEITVNSTSDFKKELKGNFTLTVGKEAFSYEIKDSTNSPYIELNMTNTLSYYIVDEPFETYTAGQRIDIDTYLSLDDTNKDKCHSSIVTIQFNPADILLDMTDYYYKDATDIQKTVINGVEYIYGFKVKIEAVSSANIRFYKVDPTNNYTYPNATNYSIINISSE